jgi:hypothetical protein
MRRRLTVPRPLAYLLVAALALFELGVAVLILHPNVSELYRAYYITRSTSCWPRDTTTGIYQPTKLISFAYGLHGGSADDIKLCGWNRPEGLGTWTLGRDTRLRLAVPHPGQPFGLIVNAEAFVSSDNPVQRMIVSIGDRALQTIVYATPDAQTSRIDIPADLAKGRTVDLKLALPDALAPFSVGINTDGRLLALRVISIQVVSKSPLDNAGPDRPRRSKKQPREGMAK